MKETHPEKARYPLRGILMKTALLSWLVTIITLTVFVAGILPTQRRTFLENLESKARGVSVSLKDIASGAVVTEDYSEVVDHCLEVLSGDESIEFLVLTRNDGFGLIHTKDGWTSKDQTDFWHPVARETRYGISECDILDKEVFRYSRPFDYSGIEWGWIHVGLSLEAFHTNVKASYTRTAMLAVLCILMGLVASVVYAKRLVAPILKLREAAQRVADGDLDARAQIRSGDEVQALGNAFNAMTQAVQDREAKMRTQSQRLAALVTDKELHAGNVVEAARRITEASAETLNVERVGVWLFNNDRLFIECIDQFTLGSRAHDCGARLNREGHEKYFSALDGSRAIAVSDAFADPRTSCLVENYLRPLNIASMMDAPIRVGGRVVGVICQEKVGALRQWTLEEEIFAGSLSDLLALALEARDRCTVQEELLAAKDAAEAASEAKSQFLANMSHEIRTPLNGIVGMLKLLRNSPLDEKQKRYADIAVASSGSLLSVINDILDFSKIEAGKMDLEIVDVAVQRTVEDVVSMFAEKASLKGLAVGSLVDPAVPTSLRGDPNRLSQVLINLVGNAIKFTETGKVLIRCDVKQHTSTRVCLEFEIEDTGVGMPEEVRCSIFDSFTQADSSTTRIHGGTGLGLAISKQLVELMGGTIGVRSNVDVGSTFWFTVLLQTHEEGSPPSLARATDLRGLRVMIAEESDSYREIMRQQVTAWGCDPTEVRDGRSAESALRQAVSEDRPFRVVLVSNSLPDMDAASFARCVRVDDCLQDTRLIHMSNAENAESADAVERDFQISLIRPVAQSALYNAIIIAASSERRKTTLVSRQARKRPYTTLPSPVHILLAEDNEINQEVALEVLQSAGCSCDCAGSGQDAVELVFQRHYDLVLMDCQMPGMDGFDATRTIRSREEQQARLGHARVRVPIVALTANAMKGDREYCFEAGMDDYMSKPVDPNQLVKMVRKWVTPGAPAGSSDPDGITHSAVANQNETQLPVLDYSRLLKRCMEKEDLAQRLLAKFCVQSSNDLQAILAASEEGDLESAGKTAHKLKGTAANLSALRVHECAAELCWRCREHPNASIADVVTRLENELDALRQVNPDSQGVKYARP